MRTSRQQKREARKLLRFCVVGETVNNDRARVVAERLLQANRRGYLSLLKRFVHLMKLEYARHSAQIETAIPMPADLRSLVLERLIATHGPAITSSFVHNPDLIGGMRIKVGSEVYDGSVRSALAGLASNLGIPATNLSGRRGQ